ncbi:MAG: nicotinate-nucleotide adenylyltransferase [Chromatiaceae bacterium]|nr:nicotinate-nucleotide adenylyltransferase [Gammaproteobacteria bacterium]MCP5422918.1 nicotinate-nucleotide adenylyltransferase [Chromatiaceae bacterium]
MIGVLGGTFDPVHHGHLRIALDARERLGLDHVRLVPLSRAVHRGQPATPGWLRRAMLTAATDGRPGLRVDDRELRREGPSYTVDTLRSLHDEQPDRALCLLLGEDAFAGFPDWRAPEEILTLANLAVLQRPGHALSDDPRLQALLAARQVAELDSAGAGGITLCPVTQLEIASSDIRRRVAAGQSIDFLTPDPVIGLIREHRLYDMDD